jgi:hypothetical protein
MLTSYQPAPPGKEGSVLTISLAQQRAQSVGCLGSRLGWVYEDVCDRQVLPVGEHACAVGPGERGQGGCCAGHRYTQGDWGLSSTNHHSHSWPWGWQAQRCAVGQSPRQAAAALYTDLSAACVCHRHRLWVHHWNAVVQKEQHKTFQRYENIKLRSCSDVNSNYHHKLTGN